MRTWVYRVAHNVATTHILRPKANMPVLVTLDDVDAHPVSIDGEALIDRQRSLERLHALIRQLRPVDHQVILLYLEELDAASIAEITGLSAGSVATRVHRIKQQLTARFHSGATANE